MIADRYRVVEALGRGSFADAYHCEDTVRGGDVVVELYDLKFWVVGIFLMSRALHAMFGETRLHIGQARFSLRQTLFGAGRTYDGETAQLEGASEATSNVRVNGQPLAHCVLLVGAREIAFGSSLGRREREWVVAVINDHVERATGSRRPALAGELR